MIHKGERLREPEMLFAALRMKHGNDVDSAGLEAPDRLRPVSETMLARKPPDSASALSRSMLKPVGIPLSSHSNGGYEASPPKTMTDSLNVNAVTERLRKRPTTRSNGRLPLDA